MAKVNTETVTATEAKTESKKFKTLNAAIIGAKREFPFRYAPMKKIKEGKKVPCKIDIDTDNNQILCLIQDDEGEWVPCGRVNPEAEEGLTAYDDMLRIISMYKDGDELPEMEAQLTELGGSSNATIAVIMELKIFGQTAIEQATEKMAEESEMDEKAFEKLKKWLDTLNLSEKAIIGFFEMLKSNKNQDVARIPKETIFNNYDEVVEDVIYSIISGANTMLEGPMAAGKNTCLECLANKAGKALYEIQVNSYIDNDTLLGTRTIKAKEDAAEKERINEEGRKLIEAILGMRDISKKESLKAAVQDEKNEAGQVAAVETVAEETGIDFSLLLNAMKNGQTEVSFQPSVLVTAMERGSWLVIDEFNTGAPSVMAVLNSVLDARKRIQVPGYGLVEASEGFRVFATMNPEYEGTFALNPATSSRFNHIMFRAADKIGPIILSRVPSAKKDFIKDAEKIYTEIRKSIDTGKFSQESMNVRGFIEAAKMVELGRGNKKALLTCVANGIMEMDDRNSIKSAIEVSIAD